MSDSKPRRPKPKFTRLTPGVVEQVGQKGLISNHNFLHYPLYTSHRDGKSKVDSIQINLKPFELADGQKVVFKAIYKAGVPTAFDARLLYEFLYRFQEGIGKVDEASYSIEIPSIRNLMLSLGWDSEINSNKDFKDRVIKGFDRWMGTTIYFEKFYKSSDKAHHKAKIVSPIGRYDVVSDIKGESKICPIKITLNPGFLKLWQGDEFYRSTLFLDLINCFRFDISHRLYDLIIANKEAIKGRTLRVTEFKDEVDSLGFKGYFIHVDTILDKLGLGGDLSPHFRKGRFIEQLLNALDEDIRPIFPELRMDFDKGKSLIRFFLRNQVTN